MNGATPRLRISRPAGRPFCPHQGKIPSKNRESSRFCALFRASSYRGNGGDPGAREMGNCGPSPERGAREPERGGRCEKSIRLWYGGFFRLLGKALFRFAFYIADEPRSPLVAR